jgi:chromosome segregation ATPase
MNNYIGEWVTDLRIQTNTLKTKIDEIGTQVQDISQDFATLKSTTSAAISEVSAAATIAEVVAGRKYTEALHEIKEMMTKQMNEIRELREHEQTSFAALLRQNNDLIQELAKVKQAQNVAEGDVTLLRAENREFKRLVEEEAKLLRVENQEMKKLIEKSTRKVEFAVARQLGLEAREKEGEGDMDDALMEVLWPQGWDDDEGVKKRDEGKDLARGVLADDPGFRIPKHRLGRGKGSGGWCTVM